MKNNLTNTTKVSESVLKDKNNIVRISKSTIDELKRLAKNKSATIKDKAAE